MKDKNAVAGVCSKGLRLNKGKQKVSIGDEALPEHHAILHNKVSPEKFFAEVVGKHDVGERADGSYFPLGTFL